MKHDNDAITSYVKPRKGEREFHDEHSACWDQDDVQIRNYGIVAKPREKPILNPQKKPVPDAITSSGAKNMSIASSTSSSDSISQGPVLFNCLCPHLTAKFLTEDVVKNKSFTQCVASAQPSILRFINLRDQYRAQRKKHRRSNLERNLEAVDVHIQKVVKLIMKASEIVVSPSMGLDVLSRSCAQKQAILLQIGQSLLALKKEVSKKRLLNDFNRSLVQQKHTCQHTDVYVQCHNGTEFTWSNAYETIDDMENAGLPGKEFPLNFRQLR